MVDLSSKRDLVSTLADYCSHSALLLRNSATYSLDDAPDLVQSYLAEAACYRRLADSPLRLFFTPRVTLEIRLCELLALSFVEL